MSIIDLETKESFTISKSTQQHSLQSIATLKSEQSIDDLERLCTQDQVNGSTIRQELDQFIGLLQRVKQQNELSVVISTEQEEYYSFQQKPEKNIMYEAFQRCYSESIRLVSNKEVLQLLEKMQMIYLMHTQETGQVKQALEKSINLIQTLKQTLIDADAEITLLNEQAEERENQINKLQTQIRSLSQEANQERLNSAEMQQKNSQMKHLILIANKQFESLQEKLLQTEQQLNDTVNQQASQIKQLIQSNKSLRQYAKIEKQSPSHHHHHQSNLQQQFYQQQQQLSLHQQTQATALQNSQHLIQTNSLNSSQYQQQSSYQQPQVQQLSIQSTEKINPLISIHQNCKQRLTERDSSPSTQRNTPNKRDWNKCTKVFK